MSAPEETLLAVVAGTPADPAEASAARLAAHGAGALCGIVSEPMLQQRIAVPGAGEIPGVVMLMPSLGQPVTVARAIHAAWPDAFLLIVREPQDAGEFRRSLGLAPMLGRHWALAAPVEPELTATLRQALASARQRRQMRTTLASANARLGQPGPGVDTEYQRQVAAEHHLDNFLRHSPAAVFGLDPARRVLFWSEGTAQLLGLNAREVLGRPVQDLGPWGHGIAAGVDALAGRTRHVVEQQVQLRGETRVLEAMLMPAFAGPHQSRGTSVVLRDVTARRHAQEQLREANLKLQQLVSERTEALEQSQIALMQAQKLQSIGKLTGGVAHDFNNVLQVIGSNLQLLQPLVHDRPEADRLLRGAMAAVDRGAKLSSQLLAFARRQPLAPVPLNMARKVGEMGDLLRRALGESIEVETVLAGGLWTALADANQLENVILNLAINARDAMPEGGRLTIEVANVVLDEQYTAGLPDVEPGQYVMLAVSDTGHGMPPEVAAQAFEPFFTTKPEGQGTGLGLSMAYGFAKQSGGHIRIYSEPGHGTTIRLYLPRSLEKELDAPRPVAGPVEGGTETILVVEDDLAVQATVVQALQGLGYRVLRAADAQAALSILQSGVQVDLLFTDVVMPGPLRSTELAQRARHLLPGIVVLFTSGYTHNAIVHGGRLDPGVELLSKPYRHEELARRIRRLLRDRPAPRPATDIGAAAPAAPDADGAAHQDEGLTRVLLVEDDAELREVAHQMLELLGCSVRDAGSAEDAEQALRGDTFDVVITDFSLPGRDGLQLAREVRAHWPATAVVISSGYGETASDGESWNLPKPYGLPELEALLARVRQHAGASLG